MKKNTLDIEKWVANTLGALASHPDQHLANTLAARVLANAAPYRNSKVESAPTEPVVETAKEKKEDMNDVEL